MYNIIRANVDFIFGKKKFFHKNAERFKEFYLQKKFYKNRSHGLSAMMRLKNEERWIYYAIASIIDYTDEIIVVLQNSTDKTEQIIKEFRSNKIKIYHFPFDSFPAGNNHKFYLKNSIFNLAYYYNFALDKTSFSYVWKWDGDHAAYENRVKKIRKIVDSQEFDIIHYKGYDIYGKELQYLCNDPYCSNEPAIFKVNKRTFYFSGKKCEEFSYPISTGLKKSKIYNYPKPLFIHLKYVDGIEAIGKGWVTNWEEDPVFQSIIKRKSRGEKFNDTYPNVILNKYFNNLD